MPGCGCDDHWQLSDFPVSEWSLWPRGNPAHQTPNLPFSTCCGEQSGRKRLTSLNAVKSWQGKTWIACSLQSLSSFYQGEKGNKLPRQHQWSSTLAGSTSLLSHGAARSCDCVQQHLACCCWEGEIVLKQTNIRSGGGGAQEKVVDFPPNCQAVHYSCPVAVKGKPAG